MRLTLRYARLKRFVSALEMPGSASRTSHGAASVLCCDDERALVMCCAAATQWISRQTVVEKWDHPALDFVFVLVKRVE